MLQKLIAKQILLKSDYYDLNMGTSQGSLLGTLLFILFVSDLHLNFMISDFILFADYTTLFQSHKNVIQATLEFQEDTYLD